MKKIYIFLFLAISQLSFQKNESIIGEYEVTTDMLSKNIKKSNKVTYFLSFEKTKVILSISSKDLDASWCEGIYSIKKMKDMFYCKGTCSDDDPRTDFYLKKVNDKIYIKSAIFVNKEWLILSKSD